MSIASEITRINNNIASAYTACNNKGATMPVTQNSANLATCIGSIQTGGGGIPREVSVQGVYQMPTSNFTFTLPNTATDVGERALYYIFFNCPAQMSVDLSSLTKVSTTYAMNSAFRGCTGLTSIDLSNLSIVEGQYSMQYLCNGCTGLTGTLNLSSLITISGIQALQNAFQNCTGLTNVNLSRLTTVTATSAMNSSFSGCTSLTSVDLSSLTTIGASGVNSSQFANCFNNCNALTSLSFPNLEKVYCTGSQSTNGTFSGNNTIQKMYFPKLDTITYTAGSSASNQTGAKNVFYNCSALTELHFASANKSAIEASPGYSTAWGRGAGNVTIYFDL